MKNSKVLLCSLCMVFMLAGTTLNAQDTEFKPSGKATATIFSNYNITSSGNSTIASFNLERAYLGYQYSFSEAFSAKVVFDVGDPGVGKLDYTAYAKNAYLQYSPGNLTLEFGMVGTTYFRAQEKIFPYRFLAKSFQDQARLSSSADLGFTATYDFGDFAAVDFMAVNGEGYKNVQADSTFRYAAGVNLTPLKGLLVRGSYDIMPGENAQQTVTLYGSYSVGPATVGFEYTSRINDDMVAGQNYGGYSVTAMAKLSDKLNAFGRYDNLSSVTMAGDTDPWNLGSDGMFLMFGLEFAPLKGVRIAPNYQGWFPADDTEFNVSTYLVNLEIKF